MILYRLGGHSMTSRPCYIKSNSPVAKISSSQSSIVRDVSITTTAGYVSSHGVIRVEVGTLSVIPHFHNYLYDRFWWQLFYFALLTIIVAVDIEFVINSQGRVSTFGRFIHGSRTSESVDYLIYLIRYPYCTILYHLQPFSSTSAWKSIV